MTHVKAAEVFGVTRHSVDRWVSAYRTAGAAAKREKALIYWGGEMGLRSHHQAGRSYAPRGRTPSIPGTGQRFGSHVLSATTNRGHLAFMVFKKDFTASLFLRFLRPCKTQRNVQHELWPA